uniref:Uncharacterized protein n=1 Tax=Arundo donax TaxID=35708 RepID=A0A0A9BN68_ARUDO
MFPNSPTPTHS